MAGGPQRHGSPFVGREHEIESLRAGLDGLASGRGRLYLVAGEPGIGKSRLLDELADEARRSGYRVSWGRCWESGGAPAYWPWTQVLRSCMASLDAAAIAEHLGLYPDVAHVLPELRSRVPEPEETNSSDPEQLRFRVLDAATSVLRRTAEVRPQIVLLDDLHCADHASLLLLRFCARELHTMPVFVAGTYRDTEAARYPAAAAMLADLRRDGEHIPLRGLRPEAVARYIGALAPQDVPSATVEALYAATEGNPLFVSEVVRLWIASRSLDARQGLVIPEELRGAIRQRLAPLPEPVRRLLTVAAVQGREFDSALLGGLGESRATDGTMAVAAAIDEARALGIVQPVAGRRDRFAFAHVLLRDVLYDDLPTAERLALHRRIGAAMEQAHALDLSPHLAEIAHHYGQAALDGDVDKAVEFARRAGDRAVETLAYDDAVSTFERGLEALGRRRGGPQPGDMLLQSELLLSLADALWGACNLERTRRTFLQAAEVTRRLPVEERPALLARAAIGFGGRQQRSHFIFDVDAVRLLEEAQEVLEDTDSPLRARVLARLAYALYTQPGSYPRRVRLCREAAAMARRIGDTRILRWVLNDTRWALWGPDTMEERLQIGAELARLPAVGDPELIVVEHTWRLVDLAEMGDMAAFDAELTAFAGVVHQHRRPWFERELRRFEGMRALLDGRFEEAERRIQEALVLSQRIPGEDAMLGYGTQMLALRVEEGRLAEVEAGAQAMAVQHPGVGIWPYVLLRLHVENDRRDGARAQLERIAPDTGLVLPADFLRLLALAYLAEACALTEDAVRATMVYDLLRPYAQHCVVVEFGFASLGSVSRYLGMLAATMGQRAAAVAHFEAAAAVETRIGARPALVRTQLAHATMLLQPGVPVTNLANEDRDDAARLLHAAHAVAGELGMQGVVTRIDALRESTGLLAHSPPAAEPVDAPAVAVPVCQLRKEGDFWTMGFGGQVFRLKNLRGLSYIDLLLRCPGEPMHVFELIDLADGVTMARGAPQVRDRGDAGPMIDARALAAYRERLRDLRVELDDAEDANDVGRAARAREEMEALLEHVGASTALGGRERAAASQNQRARVAVAKSIRVALAKIEEHSAGLGEHLSRAIKTGIVCMYAPDPLHPITWDLGEP